MKRFIVLTLLFILTAVFWSASGFWQFDKEYYISKEVLAKVEPFSVKLDTELLKSLKPAYE